MSRKIKLELLKETRPEKELSSDSEESSVADGICVAYFWSIPAHFNNFVADSGSDSDVGAKGARKSKPSAVAAAEDDSDSENDEDYKADEKSSSGGSPSSRRFLSN